MLRSAATPHRTECNRVRDETRHNPTPRHQRRWRRPLAVSIYAAAEKPAETPSAFACLGTSGRRVGFEVLTLTSL